MRRASNAKSSKTDGLGLASQLCFATYSATQAFNRIYKAVLDPLGLTYPQYLVMLVLWEGDDVTVGEIGTWLGLDSGTLTPLLKRMEAAGFVRRQRNPQDEREVRITVTVLGRDLRAKVADARAKVACATQLNDTQLDELRDALLKLRTDLLTAVSAN